MPIYQYRCRECNQEVEVLQKMSEPPLTNCEHCHQSSLEKCVTAPRFRFSGKGYYETDEKPTAKQRYLASDSQSDKSEKSDNQGTCQSAS